MAYLNTYSPVLTAQTAAHLLRRATFGPTHTEIQSLTGLTATAAVDLLLANATYRLNPAPPVELADGRPDTGQPFLVKPFNRERSFEYGEFIKFWWIGLMTEQNGHPSVLEKLTAFWQNHFVTTLDIVADYRLVNQYLRLLRNNCLGSFRTLAIEISKDPAMLIYQNGNENNKEHPNENYARELQELFTVGQIDFNGNLNYTEDDVKAAARVLTGWQVQNYYTDQSTSFGAIFVPERHDVNEKAFSSKYNGKKIAGQSGQGAGDIELAELIDMLLEHPETPKFICRKLYRWYVNPVVTRVVEENVIVPLASFFSSQSNNFKIGPVLQKLLTCDIFYDESNRGAIIKAPSELMIGTLRLFNQPVPDITTEPVPFRLMMEFAHWRMRQMQMNLIDQPLVFGFPPYYQTGYSRNWINSSTIGIRASFTDSLVYPWLVIKNGYVLGVDIIAFLTTLQPNFSDVTNTPGITCVEILEAFTKNMFATELSQSQKDLLIDSIMMRGAARTTWVRDWNTYRTTPNQANRDGVIWRCELLLKYLFRMAEFQVF